MVATDTAEVAENVKETAVAKVAEATEAATSYLDSIDEVLASESSADSGGAERVRATWVAQQEAQLRREEKTFTDDPAASEDAINYVEWLENFQLADHADETSNLLKEYPGLLKFHIQLVPDTVTNELFWTRYFWLCKKLRLDIERRAALVEKATHEADEEEEDGWGDWDEDQEEAGAAPAATREEAASHPSPSHEKTEESLDALSTPSHATRDDAKSPDWGYDSPVTPVMPELTPHEQAALEETTQQGISMPPGISVPPAATTTPNKTPSRQFSMPPKFVPVSTTATSVAPVVRKGSDTGVSGSDASGGLENSSDSSTSSWAKVTTDEAPPKPTATPPAAAGDDDWADWE